MERSHRLQKQYSLSITGLYLSKEKEMLLQGGIKRRGIVKQKFLGRLFQKEPMWGCDSRLKLRLLQALRAVLKKRAETCKMVLILPVRRDIQPFG